jgi:hypothetical protein
MPENCLIVNPTPLSPAKLENAARPSSASQLIKNFADKIGIKEDPEYVKLDNVDAIENVNTPGFAV